MATINGWQRAIHAWALRKEWRGPRAETQRTTGDDVALIISEAVEMLEAFRETGDPRIYWETYTVEIEGVQFKNMTVIQLAVLLGIDTNQDDYWTQVEDNINELGLIAKPEGVGPEWADIVIRLFDYAEEHGLDGEYEIERKMAHNEQRPVRHGGIHL